MIFRYFIISIFGWLAGVSMASAGCLSRDIDTIPGEFQTYFVCENTLSEPDYVVTSYMGTKVSFSLFSFDKKGASYLCHDYESINDSEVKCSSPGIRRIKPVYESKKSSVHMLDMDNDSGRSKAKEVFLKKASYSTADSYEAAEIVGCFVRINENDVFFGYKKNNFNVLANCIIEYEQAISKDKKMLFDLL